MTGKDMCIKHVCPWQVLQILQEESFFQYQNTIDTMREKCGYGKACRDCWRDFWEGELKDDETEDNR